MTNKQTPADKLEDALRREYVPTQIASYVAQIVGIEVNAAWRATPAGLEAAKAEDGYTELDLEMVLSKQENNKVILQTKLDFFKALFNEQEAGRSLSKRKSKKHVQS